ncbi:vitamin K epoxide reductase family protein [Flavobacterium sp. 2]|uniref:vitamin K epoxide reductase family protein n=1 Tax=Flavobacterium sp. 2 TaxID=308053 RepID=UPI003CEEAA03
MVHLVQKYLSINNFADQKFAFKDLFESHPDFPSLFAITDSLESLAIENSALKISNDQLFELPDSFLAIYNKDLVLVTKSKTSIKIEFEKTGGKSLSFDDFIKGWNGIILVIEPNPTSIGKTLKTALKWFCYSLPVFALLIISIFNNNYDTSGIIFFSTSAVGLVFSIFIIKEKLGLKNEIVSQLCNRSSNVSCESVISSDKAKINEWLSFSDLPILFFGINLTSLLLNPSYSNNIIGLLSLLSLPIIGYSIWIQKMQLKKWCLLCLAVSFLIMFQGAVWVFMKNSFVSITFSSLFFYLFSMVLISSFWLIQSKTLENKIKAENEASKLKKFKRNYKIVNFLSNDIPVLKGLDELKGLKFGDNNAAVDIILIVSPKCKYCYKVFAEAFELITKYPEKNSLNIIFNINPDNNDNPYKVVAEHLLEINFLNEDLAREAIIDWYIQEVSLKKWIEKWKVDFISPKVCQQIEQQYNWCTANEFNYTPVKIVNNKLFPNEYEISELKYFLNDYAEGKQVFEKNDLVQI